MRRLALLLSSLSLLSPIAAASPASAAPANTCVFTISMTSGVDVNNLDFVVNYTALDGNIEGTPTHPDCAWALNGPAYAAFHDDQAGHLSVAIIRNTYFSSPIALAGCRVFYDSLEPLPSDFSVQVTNASRDGVDDNINPKPTVVVSAVDCPGALPTPTTTTLPDTTTTTLPAGGERCGFPVTDGEKPAASDALATLKAAVGTTSCALCVCDINDGGTVGASDALGILRAAVGIETALDCPAC